MKSSYSLAQDDCTLVKLDEIPPLEIDGYFAVHLRRMKILHIERLILKILKQVMR